MVNIIDGSDPQYAINQDPIETDHMVVVILTMKSHPDGCDGRVHKAFYCTGVAVGESLAHYSPAPLGSTNLQNRNLAP